MTQEPSKRIVSKREYVNAQAARLVYVVLSVLLFLGGILGALNAWSYLAILGAFRWIIYPIVFCLYIAGAWDLAKWVFSGTKEINPGIPLTRANTGDLPASYSLVRASEEPLQAQQGSLLRAAMEPTQKQEELLRASAGLEG